MDKEKATRDLSVKVQPSLYDQFSKQCQENYRSVSDVIRELMAKYAKGRYMTLSEMQSCIDGFQKWKDNLDVMTAPPYNKHRVDGKGPEVAFEVSWILDS